MNVEYERYFEKRSVDTSDDANAVLPEYLTQLLPSTDGRILDIGCGTGKMLRALSNAGFTRCQGVDIAKEAVAICRKKGLNVKLIDSIVSLAVEKKTNRFDLILMSHVLEHIAREEIIPTLRHIRKDLLKTGGRFVLMVPNAQSNTGCYWAYEDFTHRTLFTAGSLKFVLLSAGFESVEFLDPRCLLETRRFLRPVKSLLLRVYEARTDFWNKVTSSSFHAPSERIYSFEIKASAR
jgi:2-polyprenyl-3-methyl-5-hydroxy-6-metoxy-1,4-benzoquinol methylase